jgi:putative ABC transport system permease protein
MTLPLLVYRSLRQHALSTLVTAGSIALACGLLMTVWAVSRQAQAAFAETATSFDAVLGARGSKLQLVLNAVFHLEASPGNIAWADYEAIRRHPLVKTALPLAVGDNFRGYRVVGTLPDGFLALEYRPGRRFTIARAGRPIAGPEAREALVGSFAAARLGLKAGDRFHPYHGLDYNPAARHEDEYAVTGILEPTNTPIDRVIWIPLEGLQKMQGHDPHTATELSAVLLQLRTPAAGLLLDRQYNREGSRLTFAYPVGTIVAELFAKIGWFERVLRLVALVVALVAAASVLASIYSSMASRRRDIAILRALGARRATVFGSVLLEATSIGALGACAGVAVHLGLIHFVAATIRAQTGVVLETGLADASLWMAPLSLVALSALGGVVPAIRAYLTPVAETLAPSS